MAPFSPLKTLPDQDRKRFYDITLGFMFVAAAALVGRTVGDALFLERYSASDLAYTYPATALTISTVAYGYAKWASRWPLARIISLLAGLLAGLCVILRGVLVFPEYDSARVAAYLIGDLVVNLPMILFWSFAAQCFVPGQAKRLFGLIGAGGTTACIIAGFLVKPFSTAFGTPSLLLLIAVLLLGFVSVVQRTSRRDGIGRQPPTSASGEGGMGSLTSLLNHRQIQALVGLMLASTVALTLVDYQFKAGARLNIAPEGLASFFGMFYGIASAVSLIIQLFAVHWILKTGGVFAGLAIMPIALFLTSGIAWISQSFQMSIATKFAVQIFAFTIDSAALQMLYLGIARQTRSQARALAEGIGKPLATGLTGLCLIAFADSDALYKLALVAAVTSLAWLVLARLNHNAYIRSLVASLGNKKFDISAETSSLCDPGLETRIRNSLASADDEEVVYLLGVLPTLSELDWLEEHRVMAQRHDPRLKIAALNYLSDHGEEQDVSICIEMLSHSDATVRKNAVDALSEIGNTDQVAQIEECLLDPAPETRAAAIAAIIKTEDLDRLLLAGTELKEMLASTRTSDRIAAAHALGRMKRGGLLRPIVGLLQDNNPEVIRAALEASLANQDPELVPAIMPLLANSTVAASAGDTLAVYGQITLDHLIPYLELTEAEGAFGGSEGIPPILARIGDPVALPALERAARSADPALRSSAITAFAQILVKTEQVKNRRSDIEDIVDLELEASAKSRERALKLNEQHNTTILCTALDQISENHLSNAFVLLDILTPSVKIQELFKSLTRTDEERSNVIEVLENVLRGRLRTKTLSTITAPAPPQTDDVMSLVSEILSEKCANWVKIGALHAIGREASGKPDSLLDDLRHKHPVVRETALYALSGQEPQRAAIEARNLIYDEARIVRNLATQILELESA